MSNVKVSVHILRNHFRGGGGVRLMIVLIMQGEGSRIGQKLIT